MSPTDETIEDEIDAALLDSMKNGKRVPSIEALNSEMPSREYQRDKGKKIIRIFLNKLRLRRCASATISRPDPTYKVAYLGNVVTGWAKGDGCVEKPLATLWRNYTHSSRPEVRMTLAVSNGGLKATTKDHGLTEYWAHRLTYCAAPDQFPRLFCWVYRHEGRRLRHELRCHAVLCSTPSMAKKIEGELNQALAVALTEFRRDKISRQNARLSLANSVYDNPTIPRRKILLSTGSHSYRPPLERSKSAPKLTMIEESILEEEEEAAGSRMDYVKILRHHDSASCLFDKRKHIYRDIGRKCKSFTVVPVNEACDEETSDKETLSRTICHQPDITENLNDSIKSNEAKTDLILDSLLENQMKNDLLESCERAWYSALGDKPDLIPPDSDEGSLSSGCESASTVNSEVDPVFFHAIEESSIPEEDETSKPDKRKTELDFKVGCSVLARVRSFESGSTDSLKCRIFNNNLYSNNIPANDEVSLVPVGETHSDFSSLKVFKKKTMLPKSLTIEPRDSKGEEDAASSYSDESGYEEEEPASPVANIISV
ncbi:uncharacterized protein LOC123312476 [Coccinella septempunctata]|uniref:uncharacterized protein LOC123312476 n=1 Tax=Coccinella septempunctata TaxID=41139 RepID=UPI001D08D022|nr:uncharacterized protein LOC123312476 [Coccinella septempunctata]XP_044752858.1 uncharacterized protein LOC123312476 [Coccinella septempunctata]XP_044752859.1 uncharacterized protein LOC123312476 [Coccinella septempunctata]